MNSQTVSNDSNNFNSEPMALGKFTSEEQLENKDSSAWSIDTVNSSKPIIIDGDQTPLKQSGFRYFGVIFTLLSTSSFSLSSTLLKKYSRDPLNFGVWGFPLAALISVPFVIHKVRVDGNKIYQSFWPLKKNKKVVAYIALRTFLSSIIPYILVMSLKWISVADMRTVLAASVITVFLMGWLFLGEQCGVVPCLVAFMALCGIGIMTRPPILTGKEKIDTETLIGLGYALAGLALVTVVIISVRHLQNVYHGLLNFILYVYAFFQSLALALIFDKFEVPSWTDGLGMAAVGILMAIGNLFLVKALQVEHASVVALIRTSEVIFTFVWQFLIIGIQPDLISILGATLVLSGVVVVTLRKWVDSLPVESINRKRLGFLLI